MKGLKHIRKLRQMTQYELAKMVGITQAMVSHYETGRCNPDLETAARIANALGCKVDDLIKEESA